MKYLKFSSIQGINFKEISGFDYDPNHCTESYTINRLSKDNETYITWCFSYFFDQNTGCLYCQLSNRFSNNITYGWDYSGVEIDKTEISKVFPDDIVFIQKKD